MHESSLIKNMIRVIEQVRRDHEMKPVAKITVELARFGTMDEEHFRYHFREEVKGTPLAKARVVFKKIPFGVDARLVNVTLKDSRPSPAPRARSGNVSGKKARKD